MSIDDGPSGPAHAEAEVPLELAALARRAGVDVRAEEWPFLLEAYTKTREAIGRLSERLRPEDAPAFDPSPGRASSEVSASGDGPGRRP